MRHFGSFIALSLFLLIFAPIHSQRSCATDSVHAQMMGLPSYAQAFQAKMNALNQASQNGAIDCATPLIIPVAVHFQNTGIPEACAIEMALDQIQILNEDFAATNSDISEWYVQQPAIWPTINNAESCIQFCLATSNHPAGFGLAEGDYAVTVDQTTGDFNSAWSGYLNMWVRDIGPLGYSPLGGSGNGDGVTCHPQAFSSISCGGNTLYGTFNLGRTITHEVGHYLLLSHPWANGGCSSNDNVADTPVSSDPITGCPSGQSIVNCTDPVLWPSYMDYCNDACLFMFSAGQVTRMENYVVASLQNLLNNSASSCQGPCGEDCGCTDPEACNYDSTASNDDGSCDYSCQGCTDSTACNYDPDAIIDDGSCVTNAIGLDFALLTDLYPTETTWNITNESGSIVLEGGPYADAETNYTSAVCAVPGCYTLTVNDSYGDGMQFNGVVGNYTLTDENGNVLAEIIEGGDFGYQAVHDFCLEENILEGCTNASACNFNESATTDNGTCIFAENCDFCSGATDGSGSIIDGDDDNDGVCDTDEIIGCQDELACNYNSAATDAATCEYADEGYDCAGNLLSCSEDINGNGTVEVSDVLLLLSEFGCTSDCGAADVDGDGVVSVGDILLLLAAFGEEC